MREMDKAISKIELKPIFQEETKNNKCINEIKIGEKPTTQAPEKSSGLEEKVDELLQLFKEKISEDETRGLIFKTLNSELTGFREEFVFNRVLKIFFMDLILLFDRIGDVRKKSNKSKSIAVDIVSDLESFRKEIIQILKNQGVDILDNKYKKFKVGYHEALETEPSKNKKEDLDIIEVIKEGFIYKDSLLIRPQLVKIKKFKKSKEVLPWQL